jgi:hypothetical protein
MTIVLSLIAVATLLFWIMRWAYHWHGAVRSSQAMAIKRLISAYICVSAALLIVAVWYHAGFWSQDTSRTIPTRTQETIEHLGYYLGFGQPFVFGGPDVLEALRHPALKGRDRFQLDVRSPKNEIEQWTLTWTPMGQPLRVGATVVNVSEKLWIDSGDAVRVCAQEGCAELSYRSTNDPSTLRSVLSLFRSSFSEKYTFRWEPSDGQKAFERSTHQMVLRKGLSEADLIRSQHEWHDNFPLLSDVFWDAFSSIIWVREIEGLRSSRLGVLVDPALLEQSGISVYKNRDRLEVAAVSSGVKNITSGQIVSYGLAGTLRLNLGASKRGTVDADGGRASAVRELWFERPVSWPLPPEDQGANKFVLTSTDDYIPINGYSFDLPDPGKPFYAKAQLSEDLSSWTITGSPKHYSVEDVAYVGRISQGVMVRLVRARSSRPGWTGIAGITVGALALFIVVWRDPGSWQSHVFDCIWPTVWVFTVSVLAFRFLTAYRMSLVPPGGASQRDVALFHKTASVAMVGLALIPIAMAIAWGVARNRSEDRGGPSWFSRVRGTVLVSIFGVCIAGAGVVWYRGHASLALGIVLGMGGLLLFARLGMRREEFGVSKPVTDGLLLSLPIIWVLVAIVFGTQQQSFMGLRISTSTHLVTVLVLWLFCSRIPGRMIWRAALGCAALLPLGLQALPPLRDRGVLLYSVPLVFLVFIVWFWRYPRRLRSGIASLAFWATIAAIAVVGVVALQKSSDNVAQYRIQTWLGRDTEILLGTSEAPNFDFDHLRRNMLHRWQMLAYSAKGSSSPFGFGRAPLSNVGMSYATSMSDSSFSIYVLGEHGRRTALLIIGFLVSIGCLILLAIPFLQDDISSWGGSVAVLFVTGGFFIVNTLYMALANVGKAPFTGQNIPFLSLDSGGDLFQGGALLALVSFVLGSESAPRIRVNRDDFPLQLVPSWLHQWLASLPRLRTAQWHLAIIATLLVVCVGMAALWHRIDYLGNNCELEFCVDHTLDSVVTRTIQSHMPEGRKDLSASGSASESAQTAWMLTPQGTLEDTGAIDTTRLEREVVSAFNMRPDKYDPGKGYLYLERVADGIRVRSNQDYFRVPLPFGEHGLWRGTITAHDQRGPMPTICGFGSKQRATAYCLSLSEYGAPLTRKDCGAQSRAEAPEVLDSVLPLLEAIQAEGRVTSSGYVCVDRHGNSIFSVQRIGNNVRISGYSGVRILQDGRPLSDATAALAPGAVLHVVVTSDPSSSQNLIYLSSSDTTLAFTQWRNGRYRRVFPYGPYVPMAYALGVAADNLAHDLNILRLSLDIRLQEQLLADFGKYIARHPEYKTNDPLGSRLAGVVLDAFTGEIRALPSWPYADPSDPGFEHALEVSGPRTRQALLRNHNFDDHVVGSTIKPLVFSSIASELWPDDISKLEVFNVADNTRNREHLHDHIAGVPLGQSWDCDNSLNVMNAKEFLVRSLDFYEATLGFVGSATDSRAWKEMVSNTRTRLSTRINYKGKSYLDLGRLRETPYSRSLIALEDLDASTYNAPRMSSVNQGDTLLLRGLRDMFDAPTALENQRRVRFELASSFVPSLALGAGKSDDDSRWNVPLSVVTPELIRIDPFEKPYPDFILCLLGGGPSCKFNNVWMAQAGARIASGHLVSATLESRVEPGRSGSLPSPLDQQEWVNERLIDPLHDVGLPPYGTAKDLHTQILKKCKSIKDSDCYLAVYKTGTIDEGDVESKESEALLFILGLWRAGKFVPGQTVAGFVYMQDSKNKKSPGQGCPKGLDCGFKKFEFAGPIVSDVATYLRELSSPTNTNTEARADTRK